MPAKVVRKPHREKTRPLGEVPAWAWIRFDGKLCWRIGKTVVKDGKMIRVASVEYDEIYELPVETEVSLRKVTCCDEEL